MNNAMIKIDERRQIQIPIDNGGGVINIVIPHAHYSIYEADEICKKYRQYGYHCGIIYRYAHRVSGKGYIGQTIHPLNRHKNHIRNAKSKSTYDVWRNALKRHGIECFDYYIIDIKYHKDERILHELLNESEKHYIKWYHTSVKEWRYNVAEGGQTQPSKSSVEKAVDMFDIDGNYIRTYTYLTKASAQFGFTGNTIQQVCNHHHYIAGGFLWAWHGEQPVIPKGNKIYSYDNNGVFVKEYENEFQASKELGGTSGGISPALKDKYRLAYGMYWRKYKTDVIPLSDFPNAIYAYDLNGTFARGFINLSKAKEFTKENSSSGISHAIIRKTAHLGYLWRKEYKPCIDPSDGRKINKAAVMVISPDKTSKRYEMIKDAAADNNITTTSIHRSIKLGIALPNGIKFIRINEETKSSANAKYKF